MEVNQDGFLEELLSLGKETFDDPNSVEMSDLFTPSWGFESFDGIITNPLLPPPTLPTPYECFSSPIIRPNLDCSFTDLYAPMFDLVDDFRPYYNQKKLETPLNEEFSVPIVDEDELGLQEDNISQLQGSCKVEMGQSMEVPGFSVEFCVEKSKKKKKKRKVEGQPSKNLMAERRRRKRLNDRLSMLRSVVPKISKMDRTSILGDTIDYMKELQERINNLQEEIDENSSDVSLFKSRNPNDVMVRTSPKFDVERQNADTRIEICCTGKPGLLLSTITTLEAMGLEIKQCVISCFNDFSLQASCSEELEQRTLVKSEDMKQALFRNAGYGGKCM